MSLLLILAKLFRMWLPLSCGLVTMFCSAIPAAASLLTLCGQWLSACRVPLRSEICPGRKAKTTCTEHPPVGELFRIWITTVLFVQVAVMKFHREKINKLDNRPVWGLGLLLCCHIGIATFDF